MPRPALRQVFLSSRVASKPVLTIECWLVWAGHSRCKNKKLCGWCQHYRLHITSITSCSCNDGKSINNSMRGKSTCFRRILNEAAQCIQHNGRWHSFFATMSRTWGSLSGRRNQLMKHLALVLLDMCRYFFFFFLSLLNSLQRLRSVVMPVSWVYSQKNVKIRTVFFHEAIMILVVMLGKIELVAESPCWVLAAAIQALVKHISFLKFLTKTLEF